MASPYYAKQTVSETLTSGTVDTVSFTSDGTSTGTPLRYDYVQVANLGPTDPVYVTTDGTAPAVGGSDNGVAVYPGDTAVLSNRAMIWYQSSRVIPQGANQFGSGNTVTGPSSPGMVQPMESLAGQMENPGTTVKLISSGNPAYVVSAAG